VAIKAGQILSYTDESLTPAGAGIHFARLLMPDGDVEGYVAEARERILAECDYRQELHWQQRFGEFFQGHPVLRVPATHPAFSSRRVPTSDWVAGEHFDVWLERDPPQQVRNRIGEALYQFYLGALLRYGLFNADPHPGNYLLGQDGTLAILDYGCVRHSTPAQVAAFVGVGELLSGKRMPAELRLPGEFLFLFRIRFGLHAVLARLGAEANWYRLEAQWSGE
jgi:hypothetical protein